MASRRGTSPHVLILDFGIIYICQRRRKALYDFVVYFTSFLVYGVNQALITRFYPTYLRTEIKLPVRDLLLPESSDLHASFVGMLYKEKKMFIKKK